MSTKLGAHQYYVRRVPARYQEIDKRRTIKASLHTDSLIIARERSDAMMDADEHLWETGLAQQTGTVAEESPEMCRYRSATRRARAVGFEVKPLNKIEVFEPSETLLERLNYIDGKERTDPEVEAVLGTIERPKETIRDAFKLYCDKLSISQTSRKSPEQVVRWRATKSRSVEHFVALCGNLAMDELNRKHGRAFFDWWGRGFARITKKGTPIGRIARTESLGTCVSSSENIGRIRARKTAKTLFESVGLKTPQLNQHRLFQTCGCRISS